VVRFDLAAAFPRVDWKERFAPASFEVPLRPALEAIGVASAVATNLPRRPLPRRAGSVARMGAGALGAGSRVMLPVLQSGAWLYLGPGQVATGDGLVTGSGVQAPLSVEFSVEVVKKREWPHSSVVRPSTVVGEFEQGWPRVESAEALMTVGSGGSVSEALAARNARVASLARRRLRSERDRGVDCPRSGDRVRGGVRRGEPVDGCRPDRKSVLPRPVAAP
jgi:acetamidase/formamidase